MVIRQGDVYWLDLGEPVGSGPGYRHPHVVIQNDAINRSGIETVLLCGITSNLKRAGSPGNVLLEAGEAGLPKPSVVNVSQLFTVDRSELLEKVGSLSPERLRWVVDGVQAFVEPVEPIDDV
jgi:mRNA interferase MazF